MDVHVFSSGVTVRFGDQIEFGDTVYNTCSLAWYEQNAGDPQDTNIWEEQSQKYQFNPGDFQRANFLFRFIYMPCYFTYDLCIETIKDDTARTLGDAFIDRFRSKSSSCI